MYPWQWDAVTESPRVCWPVCEGSRKELVFPVIEERRFGGAGVEAFFRQCLYLFICLVEENIEVLQGSVYR